MPTPVQYADANRDRFLQSLLKLARIPSVSTDPAYAEDVGRAAAFLAEELNHAGLHRVEVAPTAGHPVVYGEWLEAGDGAPTVLFYAHYDVQPALKEDGWDTEPFEPHRQGWKDIRSRHRRRQASQRNGSQDGRGAYSER